jgi:O-antigen ligase
MTAASAEAVPRRQARRVDLTAVHNRLAFWLCAVLVLSPIPFGSNRPAFWAVSAAAVGLIGLAYAVRVTLAAARPRVPASAVAVEATGFVLLLAALLVQLLPIGGLYPIEFQAVDGYAIASPTLSIASGATALMLMQVAAYGVFAYLVMQVGANQNRAHTLLRIVFFMIVAYAIVGLVSLTQLGDTILGLEKWTYQGAATATFVNRNSFATFLAFGLAVGASLVAGHLRRVDGPRPKRLRLPDTSLLLVLAGLVFIVAALFATQSRMGFVAGATGAAVVLVAGLLKGRASAAAWYATLALFVAGGIALVSVFGLQLFERIGSAERDFDVRGDLYTQVWQMIMARPWTGYGGGAFELAFPLFHQPPVSPDLVWDKAHSTYLALWAELGLVAGSLPLLIVAVFAIKSLASFVRRDSSWVVSLAALGVVVVGAIHSLVDFSLEIQANTYMFLFLVALGAAGAQKAGESGRSAVSAAGKASA